MSTTFTNVGSTAQVRGQVFSIFGIASLLANAILTGMFGYTFLSGAFGAVLLLLFFDVAAVSWYVVRLDSGLSGAQRATAKIMSVATICGSTLVSVVQVLTISQVMPAGDWIHTAAVWLITLYGAANFFAIFYFQNRSLGERKIEAKEENAAQKADKLQEMTDEAHAKAMEKANTLLMSRTDAIAERLAAEAERDYLRAMGALDLLSPASPTPPEAEPQGRPLSAQDLAALVAETVDQKLKDRDKAAKKAAKKRRKNAGAAAGAKSAGEAVTDAGNGQAPPPPPPPPAKCECGQPIGAGEGQCPADGECMILTKAAEQRAAREAAEAGK